MSYLIIALWTVGIGYYCHRIGYRAGFNKALEQASQLWPTH